MPTVRIPLVGSFNQRGLAADIDLSLNIDQRFLNCTFNAVKNPITGGVNLYVEKRPGWGADSLIENGSPSTGLLKPQTLNAALSAFGNASSNIYYGTTLLGAMSGRAISFTETIISGKTFIAMRSSDGTGWYYPSDAKDVTSFVANTSSGVATVTTYANVSSLGLYSGQAVSSNSITEGTRLTSLAVTSFLMNANATATSTSTFITKTALAQIVDPNFVSTGTRISGFAEMDGFLFYATDDGNVRNSGLNVMTTFPAGGFLAANISPDPPNSILRHKNVIGVMGTASLEAFNNVGLTPSPLGRLPYLFSKTGSLGQESVATIENDIYFVGSANYGDIQVFRMRELGVTKVSNSVVDNILGSISGSGVTAYLSGFQMGGYNYLSVSLSVGIESPEDVLLESGDMILLELGDLILLESTPTASFTRQLIYNCDLNIWAEWDAKVATFITGGGGLSYNNLLASSRFNTIGKVYRINVAADGELYTDDTTSYSLEIRTSRIDHGTNRRKYVRRIRLISDKPTSGTTTLEANDNDYASSSWYTLGTFDMTVMSPSVSRCGSYDGGRAYRLTHSTNGPFRAQALEVDFDIGLA